MDFSKEAHIFRKKPVNIAAIQWTGVNTEEVKAFLGKDAKKCYGICLKDAPEKVNLVIETPEGMHTALPGDFIIHGVKGEYYPCKPDIFEQTYEVIE